MYCIGFIGAAVYYIRKAKDKKEVAIGILKALFWPAFLVYELFKYLNM